MKISVEAIEKTRLVTFSITALSLVSYALLAYLTGAPDPFYWWLPSVLGLLSIAALVVVSALAGRAVAGQAWDELYRDTSRNAAARAYWFSLGLFALIALLSNLGVIERATSTPIFGTLMGASYLALFVWLDWRAGQSDA